MRDRPSEIVQLSARGHIGPACMALRVRIPLAIASSPVGVCVASAASGLQCGGEWLAVGWRFAALAEYGEHVGLGEPGLA